MDFVESLKLAGTVLAALIASRTIWSVARAKHLKGWGSRNTEAAELIKKVAELYPTQPRRLDHVIWRYVSGREVFRQEEVTSIVGEPAK